MIFVTLNIAQHFLMSYALNCYIFFAHSNLNFKVFFFLRFIHHYLWNSKLAWFCFMISKVAFQFLFKVLYILKNFLRLWKQVLNHVFINQDFAYILFVILQYQSCASMVLISFKPWYVKINLILDQWPCCPLNLLFVLKWLCDYFLD